MPKRHKGKQAEPTHVKVSFHLPTTTNPNPQDSSKRYSLTDEIESTIQEIEDEFVGISFVGFLSPMAGTYRMQTGPLKGTVINDPVKGYFVVFEAHEADSRIAKVEQILEGFRERSNKNGAPIQESIYLEISRVDARFVK